MKPIYLRFDDQQQADAAFASWPADWTPPLARDDVADVVEPTGFEVPLDQQYREEEPVKGRVEWEPPVLLEARADAAMTLDGQALQAEPLIEQPMVPELAKVYGYHVNLIIEGDELPEQLRPFQVFPHPPMRVFAGWD